MERPLQPISDYVITLHAELEMGRRKLGQELVHQVLTAPEQCLEVRPGRDVLQSRVLLGEPPKAYLVRVVVDIDRRPAEVVTAYRTSKVLKYWKGRS